MVSGCPFKITAVIHGVGSPYFFFFFPPAAGVLADFIGPKIIFFFNQPGLCSADNKGTTISATAILNPE